MNWWWITCNNTDIMELNSVQKILSRSGFSAVNSQLCQNGYRALPHWFAPVLHSVGWLITIRWLQLLCKPYIIPPCHVSIQKLHALSKYPLDLEFIQTWSATYRPLSTDRSTALIVFIVTSSPGHVIHVTTIMTSLSICKLRYLYRPRPMHFS